MPSDDHVALASLRTFLDEVHLAPPGEVAEVTARAAARLGWTARLWVTDYEQRLLVPLPAPSVPDADPVAIDGTLAGRAFRRVQPVHVPGDPAVLWVPLVDGVHRFGVVQFGLPAGTDPADPAVEDRYRLLSHLAGHLVAAKSPYGDPVQEAGRRRHRSIATELLNDLLPPLTFGCPGLVVSGILEPCYEVAADAFDYGVTGGTAQLAVLDAMGHDLGGTLVVAVALAALRNGRREGRTLYETVAGIDEALRAQWGSTAYVTGVVAELELATGRLRWINAGHPSPLLVRRGKVVKSLDRGRRIVL
uniref:PP2C family protein-serine/threonine phosphatase n=1 Tax=Cellulomonas endophytica TaxID=2494735 RepID=UPI001F0B7F61